VLESAAESFDFHVLKFGGCVEARNRQMIFRRPQVLADGQDVDLALA
jgi:hypothetical protein